MEKSQQIKPDSESSTMPNPTVQFLKDNNLALTKDNYLYVEYLGNPPKDVSEIEFPPELQ